MRPDKSRNKDNNSFINTFEAQELFNRLDVFLKSDDSEKAFLLEGEWGSGKSFAIAEYLRTNHAIKKNTISVCGLKYTVVTVSLFGVATLNELILAIEQKASIKTKIQKGLQIASEAVSVFPKNRITGFLSQALALSTQIMKICQKRTILDKSQKRFLIVLDDIERKDHLLSAYDILCLVEQVANKYCRFLLIANSAELMRDASTEDKLLFHQRLEKTVRYRYLLKTSDELKLPKGNITGHMSFLVSRIENVRLVKQSIFLQRRFLCDKRNSIIFILIALFCYNEETKANKAYGDLISHYFKDDPLPLESLMLVLPNGIKIHAPTQDPLDGIALYKDICSLLREEYSFLGDEGYKELTDSSLMIALGTGGDLFPIREEGYAPLDPNRVLQDSNNEAKRERTFARIDKLCNSSFITRGDFKECFAYLAKSCIFAEFSPDNKKTSMAAYKAKLTALIKTYARQTLSMQRDLDSTVFQISVPDEPEFKKAVDSIQKIVQSAYLEVFSTTVNKSETFSDAVGYFSFAYPKVSSLLGVNPRFQNANSLNGDEDAVSAGYRTIIRSLFQKAYGEIRANNSFSELTNATVWLCDSLNEIGLEAIALAELQTIGDFSSVPLRQFRSFIETCLTSESES